MNTPSRPRGGAVAAALALVLAVGLSAQSSPPGVRCLTEPVADVQISSTVAGIIAVVHHGEGSFVEAGTVVLELDQRAEQLEVDRRTVLVETLRSELERSEMLLKSTNSIPREEVDRKRSEYRIAAVELELAREQLARRKIVAPITGVVTDVPLEAGEYCEPPQVLARVVDSRRFYAVANIEPAAAQGLAIGGLVRLHLAPGDNGDGLTGKWVYIAPVVDPASGLLRVRAIFENPEGRVRPGVAGRLVFNP